MAIAQVTGDDIDTRHTRTAASALFSHSAYANGLADGAGRESTGRDRTMPYHILEFGSALLVKRKLDNDWTES